MATKDSKVLLGEFSAHMGNDWETDLNPSDALHTTSVLVMHCPY